LGHVADQAQLPPRAAENARQQVRIAGAPDEVRAQRDGRELRRVGGQHALLGQRLGLRVGRAEMRGIRRGLVDAFEITTVVDHARTRRQHELADLVQLAGGEHVAGAAHVGLVIVLDAAPRADAAGAVNDRVDAGRRLDHEVERSDVRTTLRHRRVRADSAAGSSSARRDPAQRVAADCPAEEAPPPGEYLHCRAPEPA
jgi:hypothetical protein